MRRETKRTKFLSRQIRVQLGAEETAQQLRALTVFPEVQLPATTPSNSSFQGIRRYLRPLWVPHTRTRTAHTQTDRQAKHTHKIEVTPF